MPMVFQTVESGVAVITLNDSENGNLLNLQSLKVLKNTFTESGREPGTRVILIRSNGSNFCLGMDLIKLETAKEGGKDAEKAITFYGELLAQIHACPKPVVCLLDGQVKAGGVGIVCACDIVLSSFNTTFEMGEVLFGLVPFNVLPYLLRLRVPLQKARYLILTGKKISAEEALRLNLVDELVPEAELEKSARSIIKRLFRSSPAALAETKAFTGKIMGADLSVAANAARESFLEHIRKPDVFAAVKAFNEGGLPDWFAGYKPQKPLRKPPDKSPE